MLRAGSNSLNAVLSNPGLKSSSHRNILFRNAASSSLGVQYDEMVDNEMFPDSSRFDMLQNSDSMSFGSFEKNVSTYFGHIHFRQYRSKASVKREIARALNPTFDKSSALAALRSCGGKWYDTSKEVKNNVLSRFVHTYLTKNNLTTEFGNAMLLSYAENSKDFDPKALLKSFLSAQLQPNEETYSNIIKLEVSRGQYESALGVYKFCSDQKLQINPSAMLALITGSVAQKNTDLLTDVEKAWNDKYDFDLFKNLAKALGHTKTGDLTAIENTFLNVATRSSGAHVTDPVTLVEGCCLVYNNLVENLVNKQVSDRFLQSFKDLHLESSPYYAKILEITASHLYANGFVSQSIELKKAIPNDVHASEYYHNSMFLRTMLNNNKEPLDAFIGKLRELKESGVVENPVSSLIGLSRLHEMQPEEVSTLIQAYLQSPEGPVRPHIFWPVFINSSSTNPPDQKLVQQFCELIETESEQSFVQTYKNIVEILFLNNYLLEYFMQNEHFAKSDRLQGAVTQVLLLNRRFQEAADKMEAANFPNEVHRRILRELFAIVGKGEYPAHLVSQMIVKCMSQSDEGQKQADLVRLVNILAETRSVSPTEAELLAEDIKDAGFMLKEVPREVTYKANESSSANLTMNVLRGRFWGDVVYALLDPKGFLQPMNFSQNLCMLDSSELESMLNTLENSEGSANLGAEELEVKKVLLNVALKRFGFIDEVLEKGEEGLAQLSKQFSKHFSFHLLLKCVLNANEQDPTAFQKALKLWQGSQFIRSDDVRELFLAHLKNESDADLLVDTLLNLGTNYQLSRALLRPQFTKFFNTESKVDNLVNKIDENKLDDRFSRDLSLNLFKLKSEVCSLENTRKFYDSLSDNMTKKMARVPMISACLKHSDSQSSKSTLKEILVTDGTDNDAEVIAGDVYCAYLHRGMVKRANEFVSSRVVQIRALELAQLVKKLDLQVVDVLLSHEGNCERRRNDSRRGADKQGRKTFQISSTVLNNLQVLFRNGNEQERQFSKDCLSHIYEKKIVLPAFSYIHLDSLSKMTNVRMPEDYESMYLYSLPNRFHRFVSQCDVKNALDLLQESHGEINATSKTFAHFVNLMKHYNQGFFSDPAFFTFLSRNVPRLEFGKQTVYDLLRSRSWSKGNLQSILRSLVSTQPLYSIPRDVLVAALFSERNSSDASLALPYYVQMKGSSDFAVAMLTRILGLRGQLNGIHLLCRLALLKPESISCDENSRKASIRLVWKALQSMADNEEIINNFNQVSSSLNLSENQTSLVHDVITSKRNQQSKQPKQESDSESSE